MSAKRSARKPLSKAVAARPIRPPHTDTRARTRLLTSLLPLWPREVEDTSIEGRTRLVRLLERALRSERRRGLAGHWTYDLARHVQLLDAYRAELAALERLSASSKRNRPRNPAIRGRSE